MRIPDLQIDVVSLQGGPVAYAGDVKRLREPVRHACDGVLDQGARQPVYRPVLGRVGGPLDYYVTVLLPYLDTVPETLRSARMSRGDAARTIAHYFAADPQPLIIADWPEDIAQFNALLITGPGMMAEVPGLRFEFVSLRGFSTAGNSAVPHNALHDARALRDHILSLE